MRRFYEQLISDVINVAVVIAVSCLCLQGGTLNRTTKRSPVPAAEAQADTEPLVNEEEDERDRINTSSSSSINTS